MYTTIQDGFDTEVISQYRLIFKIHHKYINICIIDSEKNKCVWYGACHSPSENSSISTQLEKIIKKYPFLTYKGWKKIIFIIVHTRFVTGPSQYITKSTALDYLKLNISINTKTEEIIVNEDFELAVSCAYTLGKNLTQYIDTHYASEHIQYTHAHITFLKGLIPLVKQSDRNNLYGKIDADMLTLVVFKDQKLFFINTFIFHTLEDFIYFTLFVIEEIGNEPSSTKLILWGELDVDSELILKARYYIQHVSLGKRLSEISFGKPFDTLKPSCDMDLFSAYLL